MLHTGQLALPSAVLNLGYIRTKLPAAPGQVTEDQWRLADPDALEICHSDLMLNQTDRLVMVRWLCRALRRL